MTQNSDMTQKDLCKTYLLNGNYKKCLQLAKKFVRWDFSKEEISTITRAYECFTRPSFYKELGFDPNKEIEKAIGIVKNRFF